MKRLIKYVMICAVIAVLGILIGPEHKADSRRASDISKGYVTVNISEYSDDVTL